MAVIGERMLSFGEVSLSFRNHREEKSLPGIGRVWDYLARRGIDRETAEKCGLHVLPAVELIAAARRSPNVNQTDNRAAVVFPHWRAAGDDPIEWWSARLVELTPGADLRLVQPGWEGVGADGPARKWGKMFCPPNEAPHAYMVPFYKWGALAKGQRIYIHESAIKAINGALVGKASIGLNGVWGWGSSKHGIALVEEIRDLPWKALELEPVIVFDSNAWDNELVQLAEVRLASKLYEITGRRAVRLRVPKPEGAGGDQGFDDFRVAVGDGAAAAFLDGEGEVVEMDAVEELKLQLNTEVCLVRSMSGVVEQSTGTVMSRTQFCDVNYAHYVVTVEGANGEPKQVNVPRKWLEDSRRTEVERLEYAPGQPGMFTDRAGDKCLNTWRGMGTGPDEGAAGLTGVDPWLELLMNNVGDEKLRDWILAWCAYPLQNLGKKLNSYALVFGPSGTGKNLFFKPLHAIYGRRNAVLMGKDNITSSFNSVYANRQFVHLDELQRSRQGDTDDAVTQKVKLLTTGETIQVNTKNVREYEVRNVANLAITSNYWDCIKLDADDRRACVIRWDPVEAGGADKRQDEAYWIRYVDWCENGGAEAVYAWLLQLDISWFNPAGWAPHTPWKKIVTESTLSPLQLFVNALWEDPEAVLPELPASDKCLFTARELCVLAYPDDGVSPSVGRVVAMGNELRNRGFRAGNGGKAMRASSTANGAVYWIIRKRDLAWTPDECRRAVKVHG